MTNLPFIYSLLLPFWLSLAAGSFWFAGILIYRKREKARSQRLPE